MNFWWPFGISKAKRLEAARVFERVNDTARNPVLYTDAGVPDTIDGRFQLLGLCVALAMSKIEDKDTRQALFDKFFITCEASLRQLGIGDLSVPHKIKAMMKAFHGHATAYEACRLGDADWNEALRRNVYGTLPEIGDDQIAVLRAQIDMFLKDPL